MRITSKVCALTLLLPSLLLTGCAGYRLGSTLPPHIRSVYVPMAVNRTAEPDIESTVTRMLQQEIQRDGTLALQPADQADTTLQLTVVVFRLEPLLYARDDRAHADEYRLHLGVEVRFVDHSDGSVLLNEVLVGDTTFAAPSTDVTSALRGALDPAARDLAREVINAVITIW